MDKLKKFNFRLILFPKTDIPENCLLAADFFSTHLLSHNCPSPTLPKKDPTFSSATVFPLTKAIKKNGGHEAKKQLKNVLLLKDSSRSKAWKVLIRLKGTEYYFILVTCCLLISRMK